MTGNPAARPSPAELWRAAGGDRCRYRQLLLEHGHLIPGPPVALPCGWPGPATATADVEQQLQALCDAILAGDGATAVRLARALRARLAGGSFTCPECGATSHHPDDVANGYCGRCHWWTGDAVLAAHRPQTPAAMPSQEGP